MEPFTSRALVSIQCQLRGIGRLRGIGQLGTKPFISRAPVSLMQIISHRSLHKPPNKRQGAETGVGGTDCFPHFEDSKRSLNVSVKFWVPVVYV